MEKIGVAVIGPGNIGMDLVFKLLSSEVIRVDKVVGIYPESSGLRLAERLGLPTTHKGVEDILNNRDIKIVFDATSAEGHRHNAPLLKAAGKFVIDMTPAALGLFVVPAVNPSIDIDLMNVSMVTCGGQATVPIVFALSRESRVLYAEIVATIASRSAGPGTRSNIDEFTQTTAQALESVGKSGRGKAIIILNPAEPPIKMRDTIYARVEAPDLGRITKSVDDMVQVVQRYVPGYRLNIPPMIDGERVTVMLEVCGEGAYLPEYAGNLDIMTAAAKAVGEQCARRMQKV
jgi:acetaldehyde dehydrogenase